MSLLRRTYNSSVGTSVGIPWWAVIVGGFGLMCFAIVVGMYARHFGIIEAKQDVWGQFGDYVGGVLNPLFSLLGFMALLYTINIQVRELKLASEESKNNSESLFAQMQKASETQFQNTFFQLLDLHTASVSSLRLKTGIGAEEVGRNVFKLLVARLENIHRERATNIEQLLLEYGKLYVLNEDLLAHYFRNLYYIVSYVHNHEHIDRVFYMGLLRAQLSSSESVLLFYNCLTPWGNKKFKPLVEQYALLKTLPVEREMPTMLRDGYDWAAFADGYPAA